MAKVQHTLNVSLTPELAELISVRVASGRYQSASEVVRAGLRLLERDEACWMGQLRPNRIDGDGNIQESGGPL